MSYITDNKAAWEEAFEHRRPDWGEKNHVRLMQEESLSFFEPDVREILSQIDFSDKTVAQFCCNNGRELLSLVKSGAKSGFGFDIAENIIEQARRTAAQASIDNCTFVACDILEIPQEYHNRFDFALFTLGAITWFEDLTLLFESVAKCMKDEGLLLINDFHPFFNMLALPTDDCFDSENLNKLAFSYFKKEPWIETSGMDYMTDVYESKPFVSFSHTLSAIINALLANHVMVTRLDEYDYDIGLTDIYDHRGLPLSFTLVAKKNA